MTVLLEYRESLKEFYGRYEVWIVPVLKFILAFSSFVLIDVRIGYDERLHSWLLLSVLALACAVLPFMVMVLAAGLLVTLHCFALSVYVGMTVLLLFCVMYLLYFRLAAQSACNVLLTPIAFVCGVPYVMPLANGLLEEPYSIFPTSFGVIAYYFLKGIHANEALLSEPADKNTILNKFQSIMNQVLGDKEMFLTLAVFAVTTLVVYVIRRMSVDYAWVIAIISGSMLEFLVLFTGYLSLDLEEDTLGLILGSLFSILVAFIIKFFCFDLDYTRTERVQFEDDEYYYYVKAVPKRSVAAQEKTIVRIAGALEEDAVETVEEETEGK